MFGKFENIDGMFIIQQNDAVTVEVNVSVKVFFPILFIHTGRWSDFLTLVRAFELAFRQAIDL